MAAEVDAGSVRVRDRGFDDVVNVLEVAVDDARLKQVKTASSEAGRARSVDDGGTGDDDVVGSEGEIDGDGIFVRRCERKDDGFETEEDNVAKGFDKSLNFGKARDSISVGVGDGAGEFLEHDLEGNNHTGIRSPRGCVRSREREGRGRRKHLRRHNSAVRPRYREVSHISGLHWIRRKNGIDSFWDKRGSGRHEKISHN